MKRSTKGAIAEAFRSLLRERGIEKITVKDVVARCGVNRQTFYYYFCDIYDLLAWSLDDALASYLEEHPEQQEDWQAKIRTVFYFFRDNRVLILHAYDSSNRAQYERFLFQWIQPIIQERIESYPQAERVPEEKREFISQIYTWMCSNLVFEWLEKGMPDEHKTRLDDFFTLLNGSLGVALDKFQEP